MPVVAPLLVAGAVYSGAAAAIGTAIVGATVSTAIATAVGAGIVGTAAGLATGQKFEDALKTGVMSGLTAGIGGTIGAAVAPGSSAAVQSIIGGSITGAAAFSIAGGDPLKGAIVGAIGSVASTSYAPTVGKALGATTDVAAKTVGNAAINAGLSGVQAAVTGGDIKKSMLTGAVTGALIINAKDFTESVLGAETVKGVENLTNLKESDVHNLFTNAVLSGVVAGANNQDVFQAFSNNLISAGLSKSLANAMEVSFRDAFVGREEDLAGIISTVSGVTRTAINAELYGEDVDKAIENAMPGIILSSFQAYETTRTAREERERLKAEEQKKLEDQLKQINELAEAQNGIVANVRSLEAQRDSLITEYNEVYDKYRELAKWGDAWLSAGLIARKNSYVVTLNDLNSQFENVEKQISDQVALFEGNKTRLETLSTTFNESLARFGGLEQFSGQVVQTPEQRVNNLIAANQTEIDNINREAMEMMFSESQTAALPALAPAVSIAGHAALGALLWLANKYREVFKDDPVAQETVMQVFINQNPKVLEEAKKVDPNVRVRQTINPQTKKPELTVDIPNKENLPEPTKQFLERVDAEVKKPDTEMKDISDAVLNVLIDAFQPKPEPKPEPVPEPKPIPVQPTEPEKIDTTVKKDQGQKGTEGTQGAAGGAPSGPSQPGAQQPTDQDVIDVVDTGPSPITPAPVAPSEPTSIYAPTSPTAYAPSTATVPGGPASLSGQRRSRFGGLSRSGSAAQTPAPAPVEPAPVTPVAPTPVEPTEPSTPAPAPVEPAPPPAPSGPTPEQIAEQQRIEDEAKRAAEEERIREEMARQQAEELRLEQERLEQEKLLADAAEAKRIADEQARLAEEQRLAEEEAERARIAAEKFEADVVASRNALSQIIAVTTPSDFQVPQLSTTDRNTFNQQQIEYNNLANDIQNQIDSLTNQRNQTTLIFDSFDPAIKENLRANFNSQINQLNSDINNLQQQKNRTTNLANEAGAAASQFESDVSRGLTQKQQLATTSEARFAEPDQRATFAQEGYKFGTENLTPFVEQRQFFEGQSQELRNEINRLLDARDQTTAIYESFDRDVQNRLRDSYNNQIRNLNDQIQQLQNEQSLAEQATQLTSQEISDIESFLESIRTGRAEQVETARGVRTEREQAQYEKEQAEFEKALEDLEADIAKARSDEEKAQARQLFTTRQRNRLRETGRLTGGLQSQIDAELGNLLDQYEDAQIRAGRAETQKEGLVAPQQPGDAGRGISDQDVIDLLGLDRGTAERYGFFGDTDGVAGGLGPGAGVEGGGVGAGVEGAGPGAAEEGVGPGASEEGVGPGGGAEDVITRLRPIVIYDQKTGQPRATQGIPQRVTAQSVEGILGDKEPLFGGDDDEQRAIWNRRSLRLRKALGL